MNLLKAIKVSHRLRDSGLNVVRMRGEWCACEVSYKTQSYVYARNKLARHPIIEKILKYINFI